MQMFLILPWFMMLFIWKKLIGYIVLAALFIANMSISFYISWHYELGTGGILPATKIAQDNYQKYYYERPWVRITPYLVGILFGILYFEYRQEVKKAKDDTNYYRGTCIYRMFTIAKHHTLMTWIYLLVGFGLTFLCVYVDYSYQRDLATGWSLTSRCIYNMLVRGLFVWGLCMVLIPMLVGRLTLISDVLGSTIFHVMAKSTYAVYLIHEPLLETFLNS